MIIAPSERWANRLPAFIRQQKLLDEVLILIGRNRVNEYFEVPLRNLSKVIVIFG